MSRPANVKGARMEGQVPHHAGHIIGYTGGENPQPIYCSGHTVSGIIEDSLQSKLFIKGIPVSILGASGDSTDACDGSDFTVVTCSSSVYVKNIAITLEQDRVTLGPGDGIIVSANQNKFYVER